MTTLQEALITAALDASSRGLISGTTNWAAFVAAALAQQGEQQPVALRTAMDVTIDDEDALATLRDMLSGEDDFLSPIRFLFGDYHSGYGLYVAAADYPEEGAIFVAAAPAPQPAVKTLVTMAAEAALEQDAELTQPAPCKSLCELCVKRGYNFCANAAQTTPLPMQSAQPVAPLTDEQIEDIGFEMLYEVQRKDFIAFARAIEAVTKGVK